MNINQQHRMRRGRNTDPLLNTLISKENCPHRIISLLRSPEEHTGCYGQTFNMISAELHHIENSLSAISIIAVVESQFRANQSITIVMKKLLAAPSSVLAWQFSSHQYIKQMHFFCPLHIRSKRFAIKFYSTLYPIVYPFFATSVDIIFIYFQLPYILYYIECSASQP